MKKTLLYLLAAVVLGILVTIVPLITVAQIGSTGNRQNESYTSLLRKSLGQLEGQYDLKTSSGNSDIEFLTVSFVIALVAYILVKYRMPKRDRMQYRFPPC